ncbi:MAG TPA: EAL domain-containing protein [Kamptonema sp.]|nr:EAL domain-containing protein [Kamptonema sp.]
MNPPTQSTNVILIIDDNPANLAVLSELLDEAGLEVLVAEDGESALERLAYVQPDLILLDIMMPGIDGFETYQRIKNNSQTSQIPVVFITALSEVSTKIQALSLGAVDYITKPFNREEVLARVQTHLKLHRLTLALEQKNQQLLQEIEEGNNARAALEALAQELELRVQARTTELSEALENLHKNQAQLTYDALHDSLTDLPNRTWLIHRLTELIENELNYTVLLIDLDRFKVINDSLGHLVGDELLKQVAQRMRSILSPPNTAARLGGDEFVILLENGDAMPAAGFPHTRAEQIAKEVLESLRKPFLLEERQVVIGASIGLSFSTIGYSAPLDPIRDADIAMYSIKQQKQGGYQIFNRQMQEIVWAKMQLEQDLRRAIEAEEFCLHYQPIVSLSNGELKGFEALLRWNHPHRIISPDQFIPLAEETRLIHPLGEWVFREGCRQLSKWQEQFYDFSIKLSINISAIQFQQENMPDKVASILKETGANPRLLKLELTESYLLNEPSRELQALKNLGLGLSLDDFGMGYSSLSRLQEFYIDTLKIDRFFLKGLKDNSEDIPLIQIILLLANSQKLEVVAEGIETEFQLEKLRSLGCSLGQGFLFSKAVNNQIATELIIKEYKKNEEQSKISPNTKFS